MDRKTGEIIVLESGTLKKLTFSNDLELRVALSPTHDSAQIDDILNELAKSGSADFSIGK